MGGEQATFSAAEGASLLGWWMDSGVDVAVRNAPRDWLRPTDEHRVQAQRVREPEASPPIAIPESLDLFRDWLAANPPPSFAVGSRRVLPQGVEGAAIMLLADLPSGEEVSSGQPIGGEAWELAERMLKAIGLTAADAYVGSLSCFHVPGARLGPKEMEECTALARRHVALAKPKRLLLFGDGPARALTGKPVAQARGHVYTIEGVRTVATFAPRHLLKRPSDKALAWKDLLLLMEDEA